MTPRNGRSATVWPRWLRPVIVAASTCRRGRSPSPTTPSRSLHADSHPPARTAPHAPGTSSPMSIRSVIPARAPRIATGPVSAWPSLVALAPRGAAGTARPRTAPGPSRSPASGRRTVSPGSIVSAGSSSREKYPCHVAFQRVDHACHPRAMEAVILCGVQGSGKTTLYRDRFLETHARISMDLLRTRAREAAFLQICLETRMPFVVDNTNPTVAERARYLGAGAGGRLQARRLPRRGRPRGRRRPQRRARADGAGGRAARRRAAARPTRRPRRASTSSSTPPPRPTAAGGSSRCSRHRRCSERVRRSRRACRR